MLMAKQLVSTMPQSQWIFEMLAAKEANVKAEKFQIFSMALSVTAHKG